MNLYAQESKARTGRFLREKLNSDHGLFFSYESQQKRRIGKILGALFGDAPGFGRLDAGSRASCIHRFKAPNATDLGITIFLISA